MAAEAERGTWPRSSVAAPAVGCGRLMGMVPFAFVSRFVFYWSLRRVVAECRGRRRSRRAGGETPARLGGHPRATVGQAARGKEMP